MLNRTPESFKTEVEPERPDATEPPLAKGRRRFVALLNHGWQLFVRLTFSSLTRRIVFLNVTGLLALVIGILYLSQFRAGLIDARIQSLLVQGEIIAGAIAASATVETDTITIDPERCSNCRPARATVPPTRRCPGSNSRSIRSGSRRCCAAWYRRPIRARASMTATACSFSTAATLLGDVLRFDLPPPDDRSRACSSAPTIAIRSWFGRGDLPLYRELGAAERQGLSARSASAARAASRAWCASTTAAR